MCAPAWDGPFATTAQSPGHTGAHQDAVGLGWACGPGLPRALSRLRHSGRRTLRALLAVLPSFPSVPLLLALCRRLCLALFFFLIKAVLMGEKEKRPVLSALSTGEWRQRDPARHCESQREHPEIPGRSEYLRACLALLASCPAACVTLAPALPPSMSGPQKQVGAKCAVLAGAHPYRSPPRGASGPLAGGCPGLPPAFPWLLLWATPGPTPVASGTLAPHAEAWTQLPRLAPCLGRSLSSGICSLFSCSLGPASLARWVPGLCTVQTTEFEAWRGAVPPVWPPGPRWDQERAGPCPAPLPARQGSCVPRRRHTRCSACLSQQSQDVVVFL